MVLQCWCCCAGRLRRGYRTSGGVLYGAADGSRGLGALPGDELAGNLDALGEGGALGDGYALDGHDLYKLGGEILAALGVELVGRGDQGVAAARAHRDPARVTQDEAGAVELVRFICSLDHALQALLAFELEVEL